MTGLKTIESVILHADPILTNHLIKTIIDQTQCPVCTDHMFVPVMTRCGHNFCYECITNWLLSNDGGATCPSCREEIVEPPYLNIQIQSLCNTLLEAMKPLNEGIIPNEILLDKENKIREYKRDLKRKRLYKNVFKHSGKAVIDKSDGVARCSNCHWEVDSNFCENCNTRLRNPNRIQEEFQDSDLDLEDENLIRFRLVGNDNDDSDEGSETLPDSDDERFIDDRNIDQLEISDEGDSLLSSGASSPVRQPRQRYIPSFVDDEDDNTDGFTVSGRYSRRVVPDSDSDESDHDQEIEAYDDWDGFGSPSGSSRGSFNYARDNHLSISASSAQNMNEYPDQYNSGDE